MKALTFWKTVVSDKSDFLARMISLLSENGIRYCVIGGQGVNAYADPVVSLDLDIAVALDQIERAEGLLKQHFEVERFPHSINVSDKGSDLRVQVQTDERYSEFVQSAELRDVLGEQLWVAAVENVLRARSGQPAIRRVVRACASRTSPTSRASWRAFRTSPPRSPTR
jgi:hypothetical protein